MKLFKLTILTLLSLNSIAQKENNNWVFGAGNIINFNSGSPLVSATSNSFQCLDNSTTVSDPETGDLLFYCNGTTVYNANHEVMVNGTGLLGHSSGGNSAFALKQPGINTLYYLFTSDAWAGNQGLRYSVIDMSLDGGLGGVTAVKNEVLLDNATEKIAAIKHSNNLDVWLITHPFNSNEFHSFLINQNGLITEPSISITGMLHSGGTNGTYNAAGQMAVSVDGSKIATAVFDAGKIEVLSFDDTNGQVELMYQFNEQQAWGTCFSPDGNKLYVSHWGGSQSESIHQYDLSLLSEDLIEGSRVLAGQVNGTNDSYDAGYLQLTPTGKIYIAIYNASYLASIESPDEYGTACDFQPEFIDLAQSSKAGLTSYLYSKNPTFTVINEEESVIDYGLIVFPNPSKEKIRIKSEIRTGYIVIIDSEGKRVLEKAYQQENSEYDISQLASGYYIISLIDNDSQKAAYSRFLKD
jgi:hypothetical protein